MFKSFIFTHMYIINSAIYQCDNAPFCLYNIGSDTFITRIIMLCLFTRIVTVHSTQLYNHYYIILCLPFRVRVELSIYVKKFNFFVEMKLEKCIQITANNDVCFLYFFSTRLNTLSHLSNWIDRKFSDFFFFFCHKFSIKSPVQK